MAVTTNEELGPKNRILQAALELFVEQGYFNTNVPDISKRSRCSVGSIYHHFLNKEEIAAELYKVGIKQFRKALEEVIQQDLGLEENIRRIVIAFLGFAESHELLSRYLWLSRHNEFLNAKIRHPTMVSFDNFGRRLAKLVKSGIREGEIPHLRAEIFWTIVFGMPLSYMRDWLEGFSKASPSSVAPLLADACWSALHGAKNTSSV